MLKCTRPVNVCLFYTNHKFFYVLVTVTVFTPVWHLHFSRQKPPPSCVLWPTGQLLRARQPCCSASPGAAPRPALTGPKTTARWWSPSATSSPRVTSYSSLLMRPRAMLGSTRARCLTRWAPSVGTYAWPCCPTPTAILASHCPPLPTQMRMAGLRLAL